MRYIVCFGDSLTEQGYVSGWVTKLAARYIRRAAVVNCGLSGYNSRWFLDLLKDPKKRVGVLSDHVRHPLFATVLLGSNDLATNEQHVPLGEYIANMEAILKFIHEEVRPKHGIFLMTPPPIAAGNRPDDTRRTLEDTRLYRRAVMDIVANCRKNYPEMHVHLVDTHSAILHYANPATAAAEALDPKWEPAYDPQAPWTRLLPDGLHVGEVGGTVIYDALVEAIRSSAYASELDPSRMSMSATYWGALAEAETEAAAAATMRLACNAEDEEEDGDEEEEGGQGQEAGGEAVVDGAANE